MSSDLKCPKCGSTKFTKNGSGRMVCRDEFNRGCSYRGLFKFFMSDEEQLRLDGESIAFMKRKVADLEAQNKTLAKESFQMAEIRRMVGNISNNVRNDPPSWATKVKGPSKLIHGIPTLMLSDLHRGEVVFETQVGGVNSYNSQISKERLQRVVHGSVKFLRHALAPGEFGGMVVILGGDMIDGAIHDELRDTGDQTVMESVISMHDDLVPHLKFLCDEFGRLLVECVAGNHGRMDRKPRAKNMALLNFDWLLYHFIARTLGADPKYKDKITFNIPDGPDASYRVHNVRYLLTHGDKFTGGNGITGPLLPWMRGDMKTRKQYGAMSQPYDTLVMGHWHQLRYLEGIIINGCLPGFNEYALRMGFGFEPPQQALWITNPTRGITFKEGIWADEPKAAAASEWVSFRK